MVKHAVMFKFKGDADKRKEVAENFGEALMQLPEEIEVLKSMEVGINENPSESWDLILVATLDSIDDIETYSKHPAHQAAVEIIAPYKDERACVDYLV